MVWSLALFLVFAVPRQYGPVEFYDRYTVRPLVAESTHTFDVQQYTLNLTFPMTDPTFAGWVSVQAKSKIPNLTTIELDMYSLVCDSVRVDGITAAYHYNDTTLTVTLPHGYGVDQPFEVRIEYHGWARSDPNNPGYYLGFNYYPKKPGTIDTTAYTVASPFDAPYWFPCYDHMFDKARCEIFATVPVGYSAASIGVLLDVTPAVRSMPTRSDAARAMTTFHWKTEFPVAPYLVCVTISRYRELRDRYLRAPNDTVPLVYYVYRTDTTQARANFANVPAMMDFYSKKFGAYPFEKYGMAEVYPFKYGGMEHQTMTTMHRAVITNPANEPTIAHELAHQWWGDCVTPLDWPHIWLKEGFATYAEALWTEFQYGEAEFMNEMDAYANGLYGYFYSDYGYRHSLYNLPPDSLFIYGLTYCKGAWVMHMLRSVMGDSAFFAAFPVYFNTYKFGNASIDDYRTVCEQVSGKSLKWFFDEWIYGQGHPEYRWRWWRVEHGVDSASLYIRIKQTQYNAPVFTMPIQFKVITLHDTTLVTVWDSLADQTFALPVKDNVSSVVFDPHNWILKAESTLAVDEEPKPVVAAVRISAAPNPAFRSVSFALSLSEPGVLAVYDRMGCRVICWTLMPDNRSVVWNGIDERNRAVAAGVYFYEWRGVKTGTRGKIILVR